MKMSLRDRSSSMEDPDGTLASVAQCIEQLRQSSSTLHEKESSLKQLMNLIDIHDNAFSAVGSHSQAVPILVSLLRSGSLGVKMQAATVLGSLCKDDELRVKVLLGGCIPPLLGLLRSSSEEGQIAAAKAIYAVSQGGARDHVGSKIFSTEGVVPVLWKQLEIGPKAGKLVDNLLTGASRNLSSSTEKFWSATVEAGGVDVLVKLLTTAQSSTQANVCFLLACMMMEDASTCPRVLATESTKLLLNWIDWTHVTSNGIAIYVAEPYEGGLCIRFGILVWLTLTTVVSHDWHQQNSEACHIKTSLIICWSSSCARF